MEPSVLDPAVIAAFTPDKMGKATLFESDRLLVGLNAFEPGQEHTLHVHRGMDKVYYVVAGKGLYLLSDREVPIRAGQVLTAPADVPHGIRNNSPERLLVLAILAPAPLPKVS